MSDTPSPSPDECTTHLTMGVCNRGTVGCSKQHPEQPSPSRAGERLRQLERRALKAEQELLGEIDACKRRHREQQAGSPRSHELEDVRREMRKLATEVDTALRTAEQERDQYGAQLNEALEQLEKAGWPCRLVELPALFRATEAQLTARDQTIAQLREALERIYDNSDDPVIERIADAALTPPAEGLGED